MAIEKKTDKLTPTYLSLAIPPLLLQCRETKLVKKAAKISVPPGTIFPNLRTSEILQQFRGISPIYLSPPIFVDDVWLPGLEPILPCFKAWVSCKFCHDISQLFFALGIELSKKYLCLVYKFFCPQTKRWTHLQSFDGKFWRWFREKKRWSSILQS